MAWNLHWRCCFQSFGGTQYAVNIYDEDYSGSVVQLTGAAEPFETNEDADEDIFKTVRSESGYLRVIDEDGTLIESMMPQNNTQRLVKLVTGTYANSAFTQGSGEDSVKWVGFLCAQAFTQPWENNINVVEFPVKSLLGVLEDTELDESDAGYERSFAKLLTQAFGSFGVTPSEVRIVTDVFNDTNILMKLLIPYNAFYTEEAIIDASGNTTKFLSSNSYSEVLQAFCALFGLCLRMDGTVLYLAQYDSTGYLSCYKYAWQHVQMSANDSPGVVISLETLGEESMLTALDFRGSDNRLTYMPGAKSVRVTLGLNSGLGLFFDMPVAPESAATVYEVQQMYSGRAYVQPYNLRTGGTEQFLFWEYSFTAIGNDRWSVVSVGTSYLSLVQQHSIYSEPEFLPRHLSTGTGTQHVGAFPCRFSIIGDTGSPSLQNGIYLSMLHVMIENRRVDSWYSGDDMGSINPIYSLQSSMEWMLYDGYIHIDLSFQEFYSNRNLTTEYPEIGFFVNSVPTNADANKCKIYFRLRFGDNLYWDGSQWEPIPSGSGRALPYFGIDFEGGKIKTNKSSEIIVDEEGGWFIPVTGVVTGTARIEILCAADYAGIDSDPLFLHCPARIMDKLEVSFVKPRTITTSNRTENIYRKTLMKSGFSDSKEVSLTIGTFNNNIASGVFVKTAPTVMLENMTYNATEETTMTQRPENHLLDRLAAYYVEVRRSLSAVVTKELELMQTRYTYGGRTYFGVKEKTMWQEDKEQVKFIEVNT